MASLYRVGFFVILGLADQADLRVVGFCHIERLSHLGTITSLVQLLKTLSSSSEAEVFIDPEDFFLGLLRLKQIDDADLLARQAYPLVELQTHIAAGAKILCLNSATQICMPDLFTQKLRFLDFRNILADTVCRNPHTHCSC